MVLITLNIKKKEENLIIEINNSTFVLSIHNPTQQIWMSSPISGAHHFECKEEGREFKWISTRDNSINLLDKIDLELSSLL